MADIALINPVWKYAHPVVERMCVDFEIEGWHVLRAFGAIGVDRVRCHLASKAMTTPAEWFVWIDADTIVDPQALKGMVETAKKRSIGVLAAPVVTRGKREINFVQMGEGEIILGAKGGLIEVQKAGTAVMLTHRSVFEAIGESLPDVDYEDESGRIPGKPYFLPLIENRTHYGEDFSFCMRARRAGFRCYVDTRIQTAHDADTLLLMSDAVGAQRIG